MQDTSHKYRGYLLTVLVIILAFNYTDRVVLGLVIQDIKGDLALTDTQLGFLSGIAFALFYSVMGIPIAAWADRGNRVTIVGLTTLLWSVAVALCGLAGSFLQLMFIRVVVGVGEAGCMPTAQSLIAECFTRAERPRAVSVYLQGIPASVVIGYFAAGWLDEFYGWRATFVMVSAPGLGLALLAWASLKEPRQSKTVNETSSTARATLKEVCTRLWANHTYRHLLYATSVMSFFSYGCFQWTPAFFIRSFGFKTGELGTWLSVIYGLGGVIGTYWIGEWAARCAVHRERLQLKGGAITIAVSGILSAFVYLPPLAPTSYWAFGWLAASTIMTMGVNVLSVSVLQTLVPERMRAMSLALVLLFGNLVGLGIGPWATGALSDALRPYAGEESLRYALLILSPGFLWVAWHFWRASSTVSRDLEGMLRTEHRNSSDGSHPALTLESSEACREQNSSMS